MNPNVNDIRRTLGLSQEEPPPGPENPPVAVEEAEPQTDYGMLNLLLMTLIVVLAVAFLLGVLSFALGPVPTKFTVQETALTPLAPTTSAPVVLESPRLSAVPVYPAPSIESVPRTEPVFRTLPVTRTALAQASLGYRPTIYSTTPPLYSRPAPQVVLRPQILQRALYPGMWFRIRKPAAEVICWSDVPVRIGCPPAMPITLEAGHTLHFGPEFSEIHALPLYGMEGNLWIEPIKR